MKMNVPLLRKIQKNILAEPLRLIMENWVNDEDPVAPCNTAACIAGHALVLDAIRKKKIDWQNAGKLISRSIRRSEQFTIIARAAKLLNLDREQAKRLFMSDEWPRRFRNQYDPEAFNLPKDATSATGRRRQARVAVKRIEHFIKTKGEE